MNHTNPVSSGRSRLVPTIAIVGLTLVVVVGVGWLAGRAAVDPATSDAPAAAARVSKDNQARTVAVPAAERLLTQAGGYPPPTAEPTATPSPDERGLFPPPSIQYELASRGSSPYADLIATAELALSGGQGTAFGPWVDSLGMGLGLDFPRAGEGVGTRLDPASATRLLDALFAAGSDPVVQGYFEEAGCDKTLPEIPPCGAVLVLTGWRGPVAMPTKNPAETLGPGAPAELPLEAAAWNIYPDSTGPYWTDWWLGNGYYSLLESLATEGHGTYFVLR